MKILVTGGAGYIGSQTLLALIAAGYKPVVLDNLITGTRDAIPTGVQLYVGDISDSALVQSILSEHSIEGVLHFAGSVIVEDSVRDPAAYYDNNSFRSLKLLQNLLRHGHTRIVFSSTAAVYGPGTIGLVSETADRRPMSPYGRSKLFTEEIIADLSHATSQLSSVILRYFNVAGADPAGRAGQRVSRATHLIGSAIETALGERDVLGIFGTDYETRDGTCERDYIHVADLAQAHVLAIGHLLKGGESLTLNCGYGRGATVREVIRAVEAASGQSITVREQPRRPGDPPALIADAARLRARLGWTPRYDALDVIVDSALRWRANLTGIHVPLRAPP